MTPREQSDDHRGNETQGERIVTMADVTWMDDYRAAAAETAPVAYGSDVLGMADEIGCIEPGKRADLVVLTADPLESIENTRKIESVWQHGVRVAGPL